MNALYNLNVSNIDPTADESILQNGTVYLYDTSVPLVPQSDPNILSYPTGVIYIPLYDAFGQLQNNYLNPLLSLGNTIYLSQSPYYFAGFATIDNNGFTLINTGPGKYFLRHDMLNPSGLGTSILPPNSMCAPFNPSLPLYIGVNEIYDGTNGDTGPVPIIPRVVIEGKSHFFGKTKISQ